MGFRDAVNAVPAKPIITTAVIATLLAAAWHGYTLHDVCTKRANLTAELHADLRLATENRIRGLVKRSDTVRARTAGDTSEFGPWLNRRSDDDLVAAIEDLAGLESPRRAEKDVPTLIATSALLAPGSKAVSQARKRLERHLMERPRLVDAVGDKATDWARRAGTLSFVKNR